MYRDAEANDPARIRLLAWLGNLVIEFNRAEGCLSRFVLNLAGGTQKTWVLTAEMNGVALRSALDALAADFVTPEHAEHLAHFSTYFDRLRLYRNYFVHGISVVSPTSPGKAAAFLQHITMKSGRLSADREIIDEAPLIFVTNHCNKLCEYARLIVVAFTPPTDIDPANWQPESLPEKPPLPEPLEKNRQALRAFSPQPGTSPPSP